MNVQGFILQASYRVETRDHIRLPVVSIYGRLTDGRAFLIRDDRQRPHFYIRAAHAEHAHRLLACTLLPTDQRTFDGEAVCKIEMTVPGDVPTLRDRLQAAGIETFEADVRFAMRYLIERGIKGACAIEGEAEINAHGLLVFDNPIVRPTVLTIAPRVLSFDIETDAKGERLLAISLYAPDIDEVLIVDGSARSMPERATRCVDEYAALEGFCARIRAFDPDVITGWNIIDFDLSVLERIATRVRHPFILGRDSGALRIRKAEGYFGSGQASITGRLALDGIDLLRGAFVRMDDYSLDAVAREVLGEGKALSSSNSGDVRDRVGEIIHNYKHDLAAFALYARTDARLAFQIIERLNLIELALARSQLTGMTPDRVAASIASFDFLYLSELQRIRVVAPTVRSNDARVHVAQQGGHVLESNPGVYRHVWVFDFKSLYPSIIRTFNIDPLSYVAEPRGEDVIVTPGGAFRRDNAILPQLLDELFPKREAARKAGDTVGANAIKILMNSFYGVLGTPACRFYNPALANSITGTGKEILLWSKRWFEQAGYQVLYGDTDSLFVRSGIDSTEEARSIGRELAVRLNVEIAAHIERSFGVTSRLELKFEKLYVKLFLPHARHSARGASKRYAGLIDGKANVEFVGMEVVRRDWTSLAKQVQRELYRRLFADQSVDVYLKDIVQRVRAGTLDDELVYRKNLRKEAEDYAVTPPHVAAARKSSQANRLISYVMTTAGPEPLDNLQHAIDREHYVTKQIRPVAEPVLATLGLDFDNVIGDRRQLDLLA